MVAKLSTTASIFNTNLGLGVGFFRIPTIGRFSVLPPFIFSIIMHGGPNFTHVSSSSFASSTRSGGRGRGNMEMEDVRRRSTSRGRGTSPTSTTDKIDALGRLLVRILRHAATDLNLNMRSDGYVRVQDLLNLKIETNVKIPLNSHSVDEIREVVRIDNKQRLGLLEEHGDLFIRANQGHSLKTVETESLLTPILSAEEIPVCVHGTYKKLLKSILESGLKRMSRLHIHFCCGMPSDREVVSGLRRDINVVIFLDVKKAMEDGMKFYMSDNKVVLTEGFDGVIPVKYFERIESWPARNSIPFQI